MLRLGLIPKTNHFEQPLEGDFSILWASTEFMADAGQPPESNLQRPV